MSKERRRRFAALVGAGLSESSSDALLWAGLMVTGAPSAIVEGLQLVDGWRAVSGREWLLRWSDVLRRLTANAAAFAETDVRALQSALAASTHATADPSRSGVAAVLAQLLEMRWRRRSAASAPRAIMDGVAGAVRGAPVIEVEYAICRGMDALERDVERAADALLELCRVAPDSVLRVCGVDRALRDAVAAHEAPWQRCEAAWLAFDRRMTMLQQDLTAPLGFDAKLVV